MNLKILLEIIDGEPKFCAEMVLDGGGVVKTRWCESGDEAREEAAKGYVHYVEDRAGA